MHVEIGAASTQIGPTWTGITTSSELTGGLFPAVPAFAPVPSGTQLQMRIKDSGTAEALDCAIYAIS